MNLAIISDVFPPKCGGSGWSSFYLAQALQAQGHTVRVVVPRESDQFGQTEREYGGLPITEFCYKAAKIPFVRNYTRNEQLYPRFAAFLARFFREHRIDLAHGQHYLTIPPTVQAAQQTGVASVATVRDYWPICYWTTHLRGDQICPGCSALNRVKCLYRNQGLLGAVAAPVSFYMATNLRLKQSWLAQADRILAVSHYIAESLQPFVPADRLEVLPNFVDVARLEQVAVQPPITPAAHDGPYLLYVGKFEANKGAHLLLELLRRVRPTIPTLAVGDGSLKAELERAATEEKLNLKVLGWAENDEVLRLMGRAEVLLFPSLWPEPLSRVLLEALGVGALVLAMDTGGTSDIIKTGYNGLLAQDVTAMAAQLTAILQPEQAADRARLKAAAHQTARDRFSREVVVNRVVQLYEELLTAKTALSR
jgi:glycogen synthase